MSCYLFLVLPIGDNYATAADYLLLVTHEGRTEGGDAEGDGKRAEGGGEGYDWQVSRKEESLRRLSKLHVSE